MELQIAPEDVPRFLAGLNPESLARLAADIRASRGHKQIKIVDGPGDGGRDIHSVDASGNKHITQCKYHEDLQRAATSREVGELPLALVKLGYTRGLFVTNARVSPQTKREFLDNYPALDLDFLEGTGVIAAVLSDTVLRALWYDGTSIEQVTSILVVPCVGRDLQRDSNASIVDHDDTGGWEQPLNHDGSAFNVRVVPRTVLIDGLAPYRPPSIRTTSEGWWPVIRGAEVLVSGPLSIGSIEDLIVAAEALVDAVIAAQARDRDIAVRYGTPVLAPLGGKDAECRLVMETGPATSVIVAGEVSTEYEWLLPSREAGWYRPSRISALIANWVRWYNHIWDVCLDLQVLSELGTNAKGSIEEQRAFIEKAWGESLFYLVEPDKVAAFDGTDIPPPSETYDWFDGRVLCAWLHGNLAEGFRPLLVEPEEEVDDDWQDPFAVDPVAFNRLKSSIQESLAGTTAQSIAPHKARDMIAAVSRDPFPSTEKMIYRSVDLITSYRDIPSPILPSSRLAFFEVCWEVPVRSASPELIDYIKSRVSIEFPSLGSQLRYDRETLDGRCYLFGRIEVETGLGQLATDQAIGQLLPQLGEYLARVEILLAESEAGGKRCTREYWMQEIGVLFPDQQ